VKKGERKKGKKGGGGKAMHGPPPPPFGTRGKIFSGKPQLEKTTWKGRRKKKKRG